MERDEQPSTSDDGQSLALRKMAEQLEPIVLKILEQPTVLKKLEALMFKKFETMVISIVRQEIIPAADGLFRKVVNDEIQKLLPGETRNVERNLHLKFLDEVLGPVQTMYKNHDCPSLRSEVWRLKEIGRNGKPCGRLEGDFKIKTVQDFLFWLSVNPERLQKILRAGDRKWKTIAEHARTCNIDDKRIFCYRSSADPQSGVIYDVVGELKGVIDGSNFVPIDNLSADKKDCAHKLLSSVLEQSAFGERYKTSFNDEASLLQEFPHRLNASTNSSMQQLSDGCVLTLSENISGYQTPVPSSSSQSIIIPYYIDDSGPSDPLGSRNTNGDNPIDLGTTSTSMEILEADPGGMLASCNNWENMKFLYDMNHLQQYSTGAAAAACRDSLYQNCGTYEVVEDSSNRRSQAPFHSATTSSSGNTASDEMQHNHTGQCSSEFFEGFDAWFMKQYGDQYVEPRDVNTSNVPNSWKPLLCILKCWFSISKTVSTRKRKRHDS